MTPMEAWRIIFANLEKLYKLKRTATFKGYTEADTEAEVMCFKALQEYERGNTMKRTRIKKEIKTTDWLTKGMTEEQIQKIKEDAIADFDRVTNERYDIAKIIAVNFHLNGEKMDDSDFEWAAHCLQMAGYLKQKEGKWIYEHTGYCLEGTDAPLDYKCSLCREFATDMFDYCPNCGAKMKGGAEE